MRIACFTLVALACCAARAEMPPEAQTTPESGAQNGQQQKTDSQSAATEEAPLHRHPTLLSMLKRNNEIRRRLGLIPHRINPALTKAAQDHANYMARTGDFQHYSNGGPQNRAGRYGFRGFVRENIAYNYRSVEDAFSVWQGSSGHYASIVSGTNEAGFGYAVGTNGAIYYVGVYGNAADGDQQGEDEALAEKLAAEAKAKSGAGELDAAKVVVDMQVVPASSQEPVPADDAAATADQTQAQTTAPAQSYSSSGSRRGIFRRRR